MLFKVPCSIFKLPKNHPQNYVNLFTRYALIMAVYYLYFYAVFKKLRNIAFREAKSCFAAVRTQWGINVGADVRSPP